MFFGSDFITVTKSDGEWQQLKPAILGAIMEHFMSGAPLLKAAESGGNDDENEFFEAADEEIVTTIKELIETRVRPAVANDGGDITFRGFKEGIVYLHMKGACSGCPSSTATLAPRHPEPAEALRARGGRGPAGLAADSAASMPVPFVRARAAMSRRSRLHERDPARVMSWMAGTSPAMTA